MTYFGIMIVSSSDILKSQWKNALKKSDEF